MPQARLTHFGLGNSVAVATLLGRTQSPSGDAESSAELPLAETKTVTLEDETLPAAL
ncbi:MAG: hypothetical protein ABW061_17395 [Polyangiaceae bacterium]